MVDSQQNDRSRMLISKWPPIDVPIHLKSSFFTTAKELPFRFVLVRPLHVRHRTVYGYKTNDRICRFPSRRLKKIG